MKGVVNGSPEQVAGLLAPEISSEKSGVQQDEKTNAMMGGRSGGMAASNVAAQDKVHGDITNLIGNLQGSAATSLANIGTNLLSTGTSATQAAFGDAKTMQAQRASQWDDIFKSAASVAGGVVGGLPGSPGGWQDTVSNALAA